MTLGDPLDITAWSGLNRNIADALNAQRFELSYVGALPDPLRVPKRISQIVRQRIGLRQTLPEHSHLSSRARARVVARSARELKPDAVFATGTIPLAFLETERPVAFWADANMAAMEGYYPEYDGATARSLAQAHEIERRAIARAGMVAYASDWAAGHAVRAYDADPRKVAVIPYGPNLGKLPKPDELDRVLDARADRPWQLLFLGVDWHRKGGDIALATAAALNSRGHRTELTVVGCNPPIEPLPDFVVAMGFVSKTTAAGSAELRRLLAQSHLLVHPARAEAYGVVFAEASAFGVPSIASATGGIPTAVREGRNGVLLDPAADGGAYADAIASLLSEPDRYRRLARSSYAEYRTRLNWHVAGAAVAERVRSLIGT